jgi:hypothetical protein
VLEPANVRVEYDSTVLPVVARPFSALDRLRRNWKRAAKSITLPAIFWPGACTDTAVDSVAAEAEPNTMLPPDSTAPETKSR